MKVKKKKRAPNFQQVSHISKIANYKVSIVRHKKNMCVLEPWVPWGESEVFILNTSSLMLLDSVRSTDRVLCYWTLIIANMMINVELQLG